MQLGRPQGLLGSVAGVEQEPPHTTGGKKSTGHFLRTELSPAGEVHGGVRVRRQVVDVMVHQAQSVKQDAQHVRTHVNVDSFRRSGGQHRGHASLAQLPSESVRGSQYDGDLVPLHQPFEAELRGFNRRQVLEHLESLDGRIAMVAADRDAALTQVTELSKVLNHLRAESELLEFLRQEADNATSQVERILATPMAEASARIQRIMRLAQDEVAELKAQAEAEIAAQIARADQDIADLKARADNEIARLRAHAGHEAKSLFEHAKRQRDQLEKEAAARREAAERDAARAVAQRESAANARIGDREVRSISGLHLLLLMIGEQLSARACVVERDELALRELRVQVANEVTALEELRTEVTTALSTAHQLSAEALGQVCGSPVEEDTPVDENPVGSPDIPLLPVPVQRSAEGGPMYRRSAGIEDRRLPRTPR